MGPQIIKLPKVSDPRGNLTYIQSGGPVPFGVRRVYYLYDVPGGESRGGHAHLSLEQFIIAVSGSFDVVLDRGAGKKIFPLRRADQGLYVPPMYWRELQNFSSGAVCLVLASEPYDESDYYRDYSSYLDAVASRES
ncbi:MAG: FdtA/QdtA family cupin domain-containing protein [Acidimicrobiia bacterium]